MYFFHFVNVVIFQIFAGVTSASPKFDLYFQTEMAPNQTFCFGVFHQSKHGVVVRHLVKTHVYRTGFSDLLKAHSALACIRLAHF